MKQIKPKAFFIYFLIVTAGMFLFNLLFKIYPVKEAIIMSLFSGLLATCFFYFFIKLKLKRDSKLDENDD